MSTLSNHLDNILNNKIPDFAKEPKKLFYLVNPRTKMWEEFDRILSNSRQAYYANQMTRKMVELIENPSQFYHLNPIEANQQISGLSPITSVSVNYLQEWLMELLSNNWQKGDRHLIIRLMIFFMVYRADYNFNAIINLMNKLPLEYHPEVFLLSLLATCKRGNPGRVVQLIDTFESHFPNSANFINREKDWIYSFVEKEMSVGYGDLLADSYRMAENLRTEMEEKRTSLGWQEFGKLKIDDFESFKEIAELNNERLFQFNQVLKVLAFNSGYFRNSANKIPELVTFCEEKIEWTPENIIQYLDHCRLINYFQKLPSKAEKVIRELLKSDQVPQPLSESLWDYCIYHYQKKQKYPALWKIISKSYLPKDSNDTIVPWKAKLQSGFPPVAIPGNHNPYHGIHPNQIRPLFQMMKAVANIDIIKFYQVDKIYRIRFMMDEEAHDIPTGDGFGLNFIQTFNQLLYEKQVPYQFVVLNLNFHKEVKQFSNYNYNYTTSTITLINEANYEHYKHKFVTQHVAGFAASDKVVPAFTANLNDLKKIKANPNLDQINLKDDPKFLAIRNELEKLNPLPEWSNILLHSLNYPLNAKPGKTWQKKVKELVEKLPVDNYREGMVLIMDAIMKGDEWFKDDEKLCGLRGLTWMCQLNADSQLLYLLQKVAAKAYKKVPGGPLNAKLGNIALETISKVGTIEAFGALTTLEAKAKYSVYKRALKKYIQKFEKLLAEYSKDELADKVIFKHDLQDGKKVIPIGSYKAHLELNGLKVQITWENEAGKITKSVPAPLKKEHAAAIKAVKADAKSIEGTLDAQTKRLEKTWLAERVWKYNDWKENYIDHPLMRVLIGKLIWIAFDDNGQQAFMPFEGTYVDAQGQTLEISEGTEIRLWHPSLSGVQEVLHWRNRIYDQQIKQPFKQAFREVYLLTPAEEATFDHSNRFAAHRLRGNTLYSLGKNREWHMTYDQYPLRVLPELGIIAELSIDGRVLYDNCTTGALCFKKYDNSKIRYGYYGNEKIPLAEVPPVILSEIMRDVDLFVAVSSISIDPYFDQNNTGEALNYWRQTAFGAKSKTQIAEIRKDLLNRLLPMTKISKKVKIEGNYLHVKGTMTDYKINLGSGNILMEPNDQYLCIVPARNTSMEKKIWLPFEGGDQTLMVILSKAFLLAEDEKISDPSILAQIKRHTRSITI